MEVRSQEARELILSGEAPDNLTVSGVLDLAGCTSLTSLPDNLTVDGWLYLAGCTSLTSLPDNLTVDGWLYLSGSGLIGSKWRGGILDYIDGISTLIVGNGCKVGEARLHSARFLQNIAPDTELPKCYVARQGEYSAHGDTPAEALHDLRFKIAQAEYDAEELIDAIKQRGTVRWEDFRLITGACSSGLREGMAQAGLDPSAEELPLALVLEKAHGPYGEAFKQHFEG